MSNKYNRTYITQTPKNNIVELSGPAKTFITNDIELDNNNVFGISMECPEIQEPNHKIYKVDVGVSRGFDMEEIDEISNVYNLIIDDRTMKKYFMSRVPQVLEFKDNDVKIIRSTVKNMRINQFREKFEKIIEKKIKEGNLSEDLSIDKIQYGGYYKQKYLKYKKKYINLKNLMN
jgi:hypothetical protein